jgi:hypothetical protein
VRVRQNENTRGALQLLRRPHTAAKLSYKLLRALRSRPIFRCAR